MVRSINFWPTANVREELKGIPCQVLGVDRYDAKKYGIVAFSNPETERKLSAAYAEELHLISVGYAERFIGKIPFRGGLPKKSKSMVLDFEGKTTAAKVRRWLSPMLKGEAVTIEGPRRMKIIFANPKDYGVALLRYADYIAQD